MYSKGTDFKVKGDNFEAAQIGVHDSGIKSRAFVSHHGTFSNEKEEDTRRLKLPREDALEGVRGQDNEGGGGDGLLKRIDQGFRGKAYAALY